MLEPIYEQDFLDCSYGFQPGRSAHQGLETFWKQLTDKWRKAGVAEDGSVSYPAAGSPQGGVVSPLLSNIFLHYVLDLWFEQQVKPRLRRRAYLIRYADDFVIGFCDYSDAQRVLEVVLKRFSKYDLTVHPTKTKLVSFRPPPVVARDRNDPHDRPGTFDLVGFTHYWGRSRRGRWIVKRKTASSRFSRALSNIDAWCQKHRHWSIGEQQRKPNEKLRGHYAYYGITGNSGALSRFRWEVERIWRKWLNRRNRERSLTWSVFARLLQRYPLAPVRTSRSTCRLAATP